MRIVCNICEGSVNFNGVVGAYYCEDHGYEVSIQTPDHHREQLLSNLSKMGRIPRF